jgi:hypothetical protein
MLGSDMVLLPQKGKPSWFGLFRVRSPLLTESRFLSLPRGTEMFQFPRFASGIPGSKLVWQLPRAYRSLPRPSAFWRQDIPHTPLIAWPHCSFPPLTLSRSLQKLTTSSLPAPKAGLFRRCSFFYLRLVLEKIIDIRKRSPPPEHPRG